MNRHYSSAQYADLCARLRAAFPGCALTTDVMVGFPGEDEDEFAQSLAFVQAVGFAKVHIFAYSRRPGTPAAAAPGQVTAAEKSVRSRRMAGHPVRPILRTNAERWPRCCWKRAGRTAGSRATHRTICRCSWRRMQASRVN